MSACPKCGKSNPAGTPLCGNCGASLPQESVPDETAVDPQHLADESHDEVLRLLRSGKKIAAIKACREQTGLGLKDAKDAVEAMAAEHEITPSTSGCAGVVLLALLIGGGLAVWVC